MEMGQLPRDTRSAES